MKKFSVLLFVLLLLLSMSTSSFAASSEPVLSFEFSCYGVNPGMPFVGTYFEWNGYSFSPDRQYYVMFDGCIYEPSILVENVDGVDSVFLGDPSFLETLTFTESFPFAIQIACTYDLEYPSMFAYPDTVCPGDDHGHSVYIYDKNPAEEFVSDSAQDFMDSLNDGTIEGAGNIINDSLDGLDDFTQPTGFVSFLAQGLSWVPSEIWTVFTLGLVISLIRIVAAFLWR